MMMNLEPAKFERLVHSILITQPNEIDCDSFYSQLDIFVDMVLSGQDAVRAMPMVHAHLVICSACREEYETLLAALEWVSTGG